MRLAAAIALVGLILLAPRAAIGADQPMGRFFDARVSQPMGMFVVRRNEQALNGARGERVEAVMLRVQR